MAKTKRSFEVEGIDRIFASEGHTTILLPLAVAIAFHVSVGALAKNLPAVPDLPAAPTMEVDLTPPAPPPPPPPPPPEPETAPTVAAPKVPAIAKALAAPKSAPAAAPNVMTARDDAAETPVRFVTDPNGGAFSSGIVAAGGTGDGRSSAPSPPAPVASALAAPAPSPAFRKPATPARLDEIDPCRGSFPRSAAADHGEATVAVVLRADGTPERVDVVAEAPAAEGFGAAAASCLRGKRFEPARDGEGVAIPTKTAVRVRFRR